MRKLSLYLVAALAALVLCLGCANDRTLPLAPATNTTMSFIVSNNGITVYTVNDAGTTAQQVQVTIPSNSWNVMVSRDGTKVAYCTYGSGANQIYVWTGSATHKLLATVENCGGLDFSPDGKKIVYSGKHVVGSGNEILSSGSYEADIYTINVDGTGELLLVANANSWAYYPRYSPDGSKIVYRRYEYGNTVAEVLKPRQVARVEPSTTETNTGVWMMNADGSNKRQVLTANHTAYNVVFSPDGTKLLYVEWSGATDEIYSVNFDGSGATNLTNSSANEFSPWPYKTYILFNRWTGTDYDIFIMNADGSNVRNLTNTTTSSEYLPGYWEWD